jgi:hypothetical protein
MPKHTPPLENSDRPAPWWSWFLASRLGRQITYPAVILAAALCVALILTHKATMSTVPPLPWGSR